MIQFEIRDNEDTSLYGTLDIDGYPNPQLIEFVWHHIRQDLLADKTFTGPLIDEMVGVLNALGFDATFCPHDDSNYTLFV
jgi:hypothetical protein